MAVKLVEEDVKELIRIEEVEAVIGKVAFD